MSSEATEGQVPDMYGQLHPVETLELIARKRQEFEAEIAKLPDKKNLEEAQKKCPHLLTDDFKLIFLRCEVFNADVSSKCVLSVVDSRANVNPYFCHNTITTQLAAKRYARYWDKRVELVGPDKAFKPLILSEALVDDSVALSIGFVNLTGTKDPQGRSIIFVDPSKQDRTRYSRESMVRALWYILHAALEDVDTQKHGVVFLIYPHHARFSQFDRTLSMMQLDSLKGVIPVRMSAMHICCPPEWISMLVPLVNLLMGERLRKRIKFHTGSTENVLKSLGKYGLAEDVLPKELGGNISVDMEAWLEDRKAANR